MDLFIFYILISLYYITLIAFLLYMKLFTLIKQKLLNKNYCSYLNLYLPYLKSYSNFLRALNACCLISLKTCVATLRLIIHGRSHLLLNLKNCLWQVVLEAFLYFCKGLITSSWVLLNYFLFNFCHWPPEIVSQIGLM